jgi:hypothetical protein
MAYISPEKSSTLDGRKLRGDHQAVPLLEQSASFREQPQIVLPLRVCQHGGATPCPVSGILVTPNVDDRVDLARLRKHVGERLAKMTGLRGKPMLFVEIQISVNVTWLDAIGSVIDQQAALPRYDRAQILRSPDIRGKGDGSVCCFFESEATGPSCRQVAGPTDTT